ncbi:hypothetical protein [Streptomyces sp. WMMC897]|uniref:hypothetical protein n=1 Tax=Streptomyces sp. WMMC897 TaxID=3014782 RepID=UPI0022B69569|nr:hypothetical protein [Streptomyces sp. WMMC897]MCZ7415316.1 hypothetical protein [Streptomyces sp. WMMC897]
MIIPLDGSAPEYREMLRAAILQVAQDRDLWVRSIYPRLAVDASDEFKFRKESSAPSGLIQWRQGEALIESARRTLLAGAKSYVSPGRHFVNRNGRFAGRYLDQVLMGQTSPGSYVVTAYAPPNGMVSRTGGSRYTDSIPEVGAAQVRAVSKAVIQAVEATVEALEHYRSSGSLAGFEDGVPRGISYEMTNALIGLAAHSEGSDITVEWDASEPLSEPLASHFEFSGNDVEPLGQAAIRLAEDQSARIVTVVGRVHLLAKKNFDSPGVFGVESLMPGSPKKVRVRLADDEDYHEAIRAHEENLALQVSGTLEKEGNLSWLYNATVIQTAGSIDDYAVRRLPDRVSEGQIELFASSEDQPLS